MGSYVIANGPDKGKTGALIVPSRSIMLPQAEGFERYEWADAVKLPDGTYVAMLEGSRWCYALSRRHVCIAHPEHKPVVVDLARGTVEDLEPHGGINAEGSALG